MRVKLIIFISLMLFCVSSQAGWYKVKNYVGSVGQYSIHMSLQFYDWHDGNESVQGSYYYDKHMQPIKIYGEFKASGELVLRNVVKENQRFDSKDQSKTTTEYGDEKFTLNLTGEMANGTWIQRNKQANVLLNNNGSLNDEKVSENDRAEIPFWVTANNHAFIGVYLSSVECGRAYLDKLKVFEIKTGRLVQELNFEGDCQAGNVMTSVYMAIEESVNKNAHKDILINYSDVRYGYADIYRFNVSKNKYQRVKEL